MIRRPESGHSISSYTLVFAKRVAVNVNVRKNPLYRGRHMAFVNSLNRRAGFAKAPAPGLMGGIVPAAPIGQAAMLTNYISPDETFVTCPNQDVVYGAGYFALDKEPVVFQVPDFGDRFWVYALYDARTDEFSEIGKPYDTKPGFYLMVGPNWKGQAPAGINAVIRSSTELGFAIPRIFKEDTAEDTKAIQPVLNQIVFYPLSQFDGKMKTKDWGKLPRACRISAQDRSRDLMAQQPNPSRTKTERTRAGEQHVIPGAEKVSCAEVAKRKAGEPLKSKVGQRPADEGLFMARTRPILSTSPK